MMNGFPNTMFLRELDAVGIPVRARDTLGIDFTFPDGTRHTFHQENHRKIMSVDGSVLLAGSSNLNPDTLQGSFRELGAQIFNRAEIETFESVFLRDWADDDATSPLVIDGVLFAPNALGLLEAFDPGTGGTVWRQAPFLWAAK